MIKLSELSENAMLFVGNAEDTHNVMNKKDYLADKFGIIYEGRNIHLADDVAQTFSWNDVIDWYSDEQYEDWADDVLNEIKKHPELVEAAKILNEIFAYHPTYYKGDLIEHDMLDWVV